MAIHVELVEGKNPRTYDPETGEDLSNRVRYLKILPLREAVVVLLKVKEGKCPYIEPGTDHVATKLVQVDRIEGVWTRRNYHAGFEAKSVPEDDDVRARGLPAERLPE